MGRAFFVGRRIPIPQQLQEQYAQVQELQRTRRMGRSPVHSRSPRSRFHRPEAFGNSQPFDVALNFGNRIVRVQVKSTSYRVRAGYRCDFQTNFHGRRYTSSS